ncbi:MAG: SDR family oxidoreductase [Myxococcales bacterium]|nr:SDR family oxidoreductase [Myxococcales bacterium]
MDSDFLRGRLALVTGGGRGIGAAIALRLAAAGARVVVTGRGRAELDEVAARVGGVAITGDLGDRASADRMIDAVRAVGRVDVLVNNAGIAESAPLADTDDAMWDRIIELNATAPFRLARALVPAMVAAGWGRVITIASNAGLTGYGYTAAYCAAKHAVVGMTRALAIDLGRTGVTINAVCPGWVATRMADEAVARIAAKTGRDVTAATAALTSMSPQRRLIEPEEVAHAVAMLCPDAARGIHGQTIVLDGGQVLK